MEVPTISSGFFCLHMSFNISYASCGFTGRSGESISYSGKSLRNVYAVSDMPEDDNPCMYKSIFLGKYIDISIVSWFNIRFVISYPVS